MTNAEIDFIMDAIELTATHFRDWANDYTYEPISNEYVFRGFETKEQCKIEAWFNAANWDKTVSLKPAG